MEGKEWNYAIVSNKYPDFSFDINELKKSISYRWAAKDRKITIDDKSDLNALHFAFEDSEGKELLYCIVPDSKNYFCLSCEDGELFFDFTMWAFEFFPIFY